MTQDDMVRFKLYYPKDGSVEENHLGIHIKYREVEVWATLPDGEEAVNDIKTIARNFPEILRIASQERKIEEEVRGMSAEIDKLLGDQE